MKSEFEGSGEASVKMLWRVALRALACLRNWVACTSSLGSEGTRTAGVGSLRWDVTVAFPPCSTFARVRSANRDEPPPLRSDKFLRGYRWHSEKAKAQVKMPKSLVDFTAQLLKMLSRALRELPEVLGRRAKEFSDGDHSFEETRGHNAACF